MTLNDLILESGGVLGSIDRFKVEIARDVMDINSKKRYKDLIEIKLSNDFNDIIGPIKNQNELTYLKPLDIVHVRPDPNSYKSRSVTISGFVNYPGKYPISSSNEKITDIISRAGGLTEEAYPKSSRLVRDSIEVKVLLRKNYTQS